MIRQIGKNGPTSAHIFDMKNNEIGTNKWKEKKGGSKEEGAQRNRATETSDTALPFCVLVVVFCLLSVVLFALMLHVQERTGGTNVE